MTSVVQQIPRREGFGITRTLKDTYLLHPITPPAAFRPLLDALADRFQILFTNVQNLTAKKPNADPDPQAPLQSQDRFSFDVVVMNRTGVCSFRNMEFMVTPGEAAEFLPKTFNLNILNEGQRVILGNVEGQITRNLTKLEEPWDLIAMVKATVFADLSCVRVLDQAELKLQVAA